MGDVRVRRAFLKINSFPDKKYDLIHARIKDEFEINYIQISVEAPGVLHIFIQ